MDEIMTPQEAKIESLLQMLAVLIDRLGGEVLISHKEYSMYEGVSVVARNLTSGYVVMRLGDEDEESFTTIEIPPDSKV